MPAVLQVSPLFHKAHSSLFPTPFSILFQELLLYLLSPPWDLPVGLCKLFTSLAQTPLQPPHPEKGVTWVHRPSLLITTQTSYFSCLVRGNCWKFGLQNKYGHYTERKYYLQYFSLCLLKRRFCISFNSEFPEL